MFDTGLQKIKIYVTGLQQIKMFVTGLQQIEMFVTGLQQIEMFQTGLQQIVMQLDCNKSKFHAKYSRYHMSTIITSATPFVDAMRDISRSGVKNTSSYPVSVYKHNGQTTK